MKTSNVEEKYLAQSGYTVQTARLPYIIVDNFPELGRLTALRFLEWAAENPQGVVSLPTGKTPEHFIFWTKRLLRERPEKLDLSGLTFVQMDDFYPIDPTQQNSFNYYVREFYIKGLGLDPAKALLIDPPLIEPENWNPESEVLVDNWCMAYEDRIRALGGIGFFLGGIGPDGHIAFNIRGSDHYSTTRLSSTNYETQAAAAGDLGGIEISGKKKVITIGLGTITFNPDCVAIIFAAGDTKAPMVRDAIENTQNSRYPGTALQKLPNARFYLTTGAASLLTDVRNKYYAEAPPSIGKSIRALLEHCKNNSIYAHKITDPLPEQLSPYLPDSKTPIPTVITEIKSRLNRGMEPIKGKVILHTGPHHDDIMLGLEPLVNRQLREPTNKVHFAVLTSGFTALSNRYLIDVLEYTKMLIVKGEVQMLRYDDFYEKGYLFKWDKDVNHYLNKVAERDEQGKQRGLSHRVVRCMVKLYELKSTSELLNRIKKIVDYLRNCYDGEKNTPDVQKLKGMIREFEEELVWAHSGIQVKDVHHLRLGFYQGDIFTEQPEEGRDVQPVLELLQQINPQVISVTMDPEGSGPDTHYKVLQTIAKAIKAWREGAIGPDPTASLRVMGYRNVWYRYHAEEANVYWPVSLNAMAVMQNSFRQCYLSQVDASFPSPQLQGPFCDLAQRIWVEQLREVQLLLGKDFFYENDRPSLRATHGLIFYKDLSVDEFLEEANELARKTRGVGQ
jgi:glucosamine-6-phosphate deaminase